MQIWMWERFPVGRPHSLPPPRQWEPQGDPDLAPTVAYLYERASGTYYITRHAYVEDTNALDVLQPQHVSCQYHLINSIQMYPLNTNLCMCVL